MYAIKTVSMGFFPYNTQNCQLKISPIAFLEWIAKYSTRQ